MNHLAVSLALAVAGLATGARAQSNSTAGPPSAAACPSTTTLDELTKALDDAVSGPANKDRTCLRDLLVPGARLMPVAKTTDGSLVPRNLTVDDWISAAAKHGIEGMYERQVKVTKKQYGHIADLWSEYEIRPSPDGTATVHGVNSIQAIYDGSRWKVVAILWESESLAGSAPVNKP
jgi:hypothetical protein